VMMMSIISGTCGSLSNSSTTASELAVYRVIGAILDYFFDILPRGFAELLDLTKVAERHPS
jgi:hypothetical protein